MPAAERRANGTWRARWYERGVRKSADGPEAGANFLTKRAAENYAADREADLRAGRVPDSRTTWVEWLPVWSAGRMVMASTEKIDDQNIRKWLLPAWGARPLAEITQFDIQTWIADLRRAGLAPGTIAKLAHLLSSSLAAAVDKGMLNATPYVRIKLPDVPEGTEFYFEPEQIDRALAQLVQPYRRAILILVLTGMRFGEMAGLHWQRVNIGQGVIDVVETWSPGSGKIEPYTKGKRRRPVPFTLQLLAELGEATDARSCGLVHSEHGADCRSGLVCPAPGGGALNSRNMRRRHWYPALEAAGLARARQHDLRHTFASWLRQQGVSLEDVGEVLGHAQMATTQRYAHVAGAHLQRVRDALEPTPKKKVKKAKKGNRGNTSGPKSAPTAYLKIVPRGL